MKERYLVLAARLALAAIWLGEGLGLKLWLRDPAELALVAQSGLYLLSPEITLAAIGLLETAAGLVLLVGYRPRLAAAVTTAAMVAITVGVLASDPSAFLAPLTGVIKNGAVAVCGAVVWTLSPPRPAASSTRLAWS